VRGQAQPISYLWWLVSRASGIVALVLVSLSVTIGLAMAAKVLRRPGAKRSLLKAHEHIALAALLAIATHGVSLLGDRWLKPGWSGITVPFAIGYRPQYTGLGIIGGYLALLLGPSFYLRRLIGARRWRKVHSLIALTWLLSVVHALGAGSDARRMWLRAVVLAPSIPIAYLIALRLLKSSSAPAKAAQRSADASLRTPSEKPRNHRALIDSASASSDLGTIPASGTVNAKKLCVAEIGSAMT
jgi:sulfoxide reductase heme-binding subunit YedZ